MSRPTVGYFMLKAFLKPQQRSSGLLLADTIWRDGVSFEMTPAARALVTSERYV